MRKTANIIWMSIVALWVIITAWIISVYDSLPAIIATRHNAQGIPTEFHDKSILWASLAIIIIMTGMVYSFTYLNITNSKKKVREDNKIHFFIAIVTLIVNALVFWGMTQAV